MADEIPQTEKEIDKQEFVGNLPVDLNYTDFVQKFENVNLTEGSQNKAASLPSSPLVKGSGCLRATWSQGGTPVSGSGELVLPTWKLGLPTPIQGLSPNSTAFSLLAGFAEGNIQVQGDAVQHLQEGNLAKLPWVTIELIEQGTGNIMGSIPDVNLVEGIKIPEGKSIREMLRKLEVVEQINGTIPDNGNFSMAREKQGKPSKVPSPTTKAEAKKTEKGKDQLKPPNSGLGPTVGAASKPALTGPSSKKGANCSHQRGIHF